MSENMLEHSVAVGCGGSYCMPVNSALKGTGAAGVGELCAIASNKSSSGTGSSSNTSCGEYVLRCMQETA